MGKISSRKFFNFITLCRKTNPPKIKNNNNNNKNMT